MASYLWNCPTLKSSLKRLTHPFDQYCPPVIQYLKSVSEKHQNILNMDLHCNFCFNFSKQKKRRWKTTSQPGLACPMTCTLKAHMLGKLRTTNSSSSSLAANLEARVFHRAMIQLCVRESEAFCTMLCDHLNRNHLSSIYLSIYLSIYIYIYIW